VFNGIEGVSFVLQDHVGVLAPRERLGISVATVQVVDLIVQRILRLGHAGEGRTPDALRRDLCKEALDEIESGRARRRKVHLEAWMLGEPRLHLGGLVRPVVIEHEMHVEVSKHGSIDPFQKAKELFRPMPRLAFADVKPLFTSRAANSVMVP
jgi:hypothetical protein